MTTRKPRTKAAATTAVVPAAPASPAVPASFPAATTEFVKPRNPLDLRFQAAVAHVTMSVSPVSVLLALVDWAGHFAGSPGKQLELQRLAQEQARRLAEYAATLALARPDCPALPCVEPPARDRRFAAAEWNHWPFNLMHQSFLLAEEWWQAATTGISGVSAHHEQVISFIARQLLDVLSPGNYLPTNPLVLQRTFAAGGLNLLRGLNNAIEDLVGLATGSPPSGAEAFLVGRDVAVTPGKVVLRTPLMELIQYSPTTEKVRPEPVLIVPAWIMKYYILDLSPHNSLIKYLVGEGYTVFCISWKNPGREEAALGMEDYLELGFFAALDAIEAIVPGSKVHATGYCLGGTLLAIANAAMARDGDARLASMTLFCAQTDFTEPGELALFIDEGEVSLLEAQMQETGYLSAGQMAGAFQLLRSYDLMWSRMVGEYLMGERAPMNDLMAWNADTTRMPARMHSEYLRQLFLNDALSEGRYRVGGRPVSLTDIHTPSFCVATFSDHVAPWRSVHKLHYLTTAELHFVLTSGGHNAGIVSEPGRSHRYFQALERPAGGNYIPPDEWLTLAPRHEGSWWPEWSTWLAAHSGSPVAPPPMGADGYPPLADAPGSYVLEK
ncbi:MAG TPA: alpha/beta fold hydrolase [Zoogloea sp.]|nr:alpha/beta fold hydrolase [Zoogloea sp.]